MKTKSMRRSILKNNPDTPPNLSLQRTFVGGKGILACGIRAPDIDSTKMCACIISNGDKGTENQGWEE